MKCEDYEDEGILDLEQVREAIVEATDTMDDQLMDYLLYYVFVKSESTEKMQYKLIISMLDDAVQLQQRASSAKRKARPESSSPDKLKQRNPPKTGNALGNLRNINDSSESSDKYTDDVPHIQEDNDENESDKPPREKEEM